MWSKVFSPLLASRLKPAQKFPQLKLRPQQHRIITHQRQSNISLTSFDPNSLEYARREITPGSVVEVRNSEQNRLLALGFYEPTLLRVDVFHIYPKTVTDLPTVSEEFFLERVREAWERRRRVFSLRSVGDNNTYRVVNGASDGIPSLYVDLFSSCFARIVATSYGAERLVPSVTELLKEHGTEQVLLDTPYLKDHEKLTIMNPTISLPEVYVENGTRHLWVPPNEYPATRNNRWLLNTAHRRARHVLREVCGGKQVLCVNDRSGAATLNAVMSAKNVVINETDVGLLDRLRENLIANHSSSVFNTCETSSLEIDELGTHKMDVIYLEHHPEKLSSVKQWQMTFSSLLQQRICGEGSVLFVAQESAPLGIPDLLQQESSERQFIPAKREELFKALSTTASKYKLNIRKIRVFGPSIDHPILPECESFCFSHVFLLQGSS
ncbi:uncharacterized protein TM35_000072670 [Trypanosoma theileri]|uniref:Uncharacterized protein n=1 Tax=Trypanosoma theileri TaxID=67003 RepID=A0A1X0P2C1_9TRYP|nr:uncharacterized protein TM35_000072670 [Trypanosoma theileri]ORC90843.1 hypothetical protein TM35_000072670 [Trypanosoma theileri]